MSASLESGLFPLPLEPFERYMLADDRPDYPMTIVCRCEFSGALQRDTLDAALAAVLQNEPLLRAVVRRRGLRQLAWTEAESAPGVLWDGQAASLPEGNARRFRLREEPGLRVRATDVEAGTVVDHIFHHACCDGLAAVSFVDRLYAEYARRTGAAPVEDSRPAHSVAIRRRKPRGDLQRRLGSRGESLRAFGRRARDVLTTRTTPLAVDRTRPDATHGADPAPDFLMHSRILTGPETRGLKTAARAAAVTPNDLLIGAMFRTACDWNRQQGVDPDGAWFQMLVPVDLRSPEHDDVPSANLLSYVYVKQRGGDCRDPCTLVQAVAARMDYAVHSRSGLMLLRAIQGLASVPGLLPLYLNGRRSQATAVVSYMGDVGRRMRGFPRDRGRCVVGDVVLERMLATGPLRPGTAALLSAGVYAGRLVLNFTLDGRVFSAAGAREFADSYVHHLCGFLPAAGASPVPALEDPHAAGAPTDDLEAVA